MYYSITTSLDLHIILNTNIAIPASITANIEENHIFQFNIISNSIYAKGPIIQEANAPCFVAFFGHISDANKGTAIADPIPLSPKYKNIDKNSGGFNQVNTRTNTEIAPIAILVILITVLPEASGFIVST